MKATFTIPVTVERKVDCFGCDHCKDYAQYRLLLGIIKRDVTYHYNCDKLGVTLDSVINTDKMPCNGDKWEQTNEDFELTDEVFTLHFKDALLSKDETQGENKP